MGVLRYEYRDGHSGTGVNRQPASLIAGRARHEKSIDGGKKRYAKSGSRINIWYPNPRRVTVRRWSTVRLGEDRLCKLAAVPIDSSSSGQVQPAKQILHLWHDVKTSDQTETAARAGSLPKSGYVVFTNSVSTEQNRNRVG